MPTPSSEPPLDPSSPPSYNFLTCPDEIQNSSHSSQTAREEMTPGLESASDRRSQSPGEAPSVGSEQTRAIMREDSLVTDDRISAEPSSRATTVSPRPQSSATGATSPPPDLGNGKQRELERRPSLDQRAIAGSPPTANNVAIEEAADSESDTGCDDTQSSCYTGLDYSNKRVRCIVAWQKTNTNKLQSIPFSPCSYLRPGTKFHGTQQSERQVYEVQVEIKYVDMRESFLCGYLRIQGASTSIVMHSCAVL